MNNKQPTTNGNPKGLAATADIWRSLRNRNYRLFFIGQGVSMIGTWMQMASVSWAIYRLTNSPVYLGINGFASLLPSFFATPFAGVMIDRWDRRRTVITTQVLLMIQAVILAAFFLTGHVSVWHIITLSFFGGMINAFDMPARQALVFNMVKKENVSNAIA